MSMSTQEQLLAPLTFNREGLAAIGNDDGATSIALIIILVNSVIQGLVGLDGVPIGALVGGDELDAVGIFLVAFIFQVLILLIFSAILGFVLRGFGGQASTAQSLRMIGFATIWNVIGSLILFVVPTFPSIVITLLFLACLSLGLSAFSGKGVVTAFLALIIAYVLAIILVAIILFILILLLFAAIFS